MSGYWIAVACAQHVRRGRAGDFMQVCHGKAAPLRRIRPGDGVVYYSPSEVLGGQDGLRSFTAIGAVREGEPYRFDMGGGFVPSRRDVTWFEAREAAIMPLLQELDLTRDKRNWGYPFRFGLVAISGADFAVIASAMAAAQDAVVPGGVVP